MNCLVGKRKVNITSEGKWQANGVSLLWTWVETDHFKTKSFVNDFDLQCCVDIKRKCVFVFEIVGLTTDTLRQIKYIYE